MLIDNTRKQLEVLIMFDDLFDNKKPEMKLMFGNIVNI
jgi:hypothetical protein